MAATFGFPFTNAQWKELERQAMIYKYMVASVPVPHDLLLPINTRNFSAPVAASQYPLGSDFGLRLSNNNTDPEPGRCKRTDGKKWRCSRDVAPDQKYCERHMHRGRPRSRKHVEVHVNTNANKRTRHDNHHHHALPTTSSAITNPTINNNNGSQSQFLGTTAALPYHQSPVFLDKSTIKASSFESITSLSSEKESTSNLDWMMKAEPVAMAASDPQWHQLMQTKMELSSKTTSYCDTSNSSIFNQHSEVVPFLNLNSYANFNTGQDHQENDQCSLFLNPDVVSLQNPPAAHAVPMPPRSFIDAWSNSTVANKSCVSSSGKLSPSSLTLSMGGCNSINEGMSQTQIGSGFNENHSKAHVASWLTPASWVAQQAQPGGPLAEVLRSSSLTVSNPSSPVHGKGDSGSPVATTVSSPSGVLQKTLASLSDSSGSSSSQTVVGCSKAKAEIALL